ncbi:TetR family transcriptional regulator [Trinickia symbiotica]|uniref:TetR/AcrR family transcriptional regulator n=1 Tax=Trinickia symbiotica TaxID=863227 RepID=A0A2N7X2S7_9BURK|nr:TetR/AcrR family transcriptional regulator [Trinickia symbiotica]PMS35910.1 TetR/AcrR family transcriptional regulator [Trinickia symbiotica]PPK44439.1 TetR family transcriptional regulator [Trinickia symbiotica]
MKVSREQVAENRRKILDAASELFRAKGFEAVTVADVMKAAGLTHGGFYGYFKSKEDLIAQALAHVFERAAASDTEIVRYAAKYLSPAHRDDLACGCPVAALGGETVRQTPQARAVATRALRERIERVAASMENVDPAIARREAIGSWSALVGGLILARLADDPKLADEVLKETLAWIDGRAIQHS